MSKVSIPKLKEKADRLHSLWIRQKDADECGTVECVTCGKLMHFRAAHCGHFVPRQHNALRYDERNTAVQCPSCNTFNEGEQFLFSKYIDATYGEGTADELFRIGKQSYKSSRSELEELIKTRKQQLINNGFETK